MVAVPPRVGHCCQLEPSHLYRPASAVVTHTLPCGSSSMLPSGPGVGWSVQPAPSNSAMPPSTLCVTQTWSSAPTITSLTFFHGRNQPAGRPLPTEYSVHWPVPGLKRKTAPFDVRTFTLVSHRLPWLSQSIERTSSRISGELAAFQVCQLPAFVHRGSKRVSPPSLASQTTPSGVKSMSDRNGEGIGWSSPDQTRHTPVSKPPPGSGV